MTRGTHGVQAAQRSIEGAGMEREEKLGIYRALAFPRAEVLGGWSGEHLGLVEKAVSRLFARSTELETLGV